MAVAFRSTSNAVSNSNVTSLSCNKPAGVVAGDLLLALVVQDTPGDAQAISGWTSLGTQSMATGGMEVFWLLAGGSEPSSYSITSIPNSNVTIVMVAYSGVVQVTPIHKSAHNETGSDVSTVNAPTVTPTLDNCMIVHLGGAFRGTGNSSFPASPGTSPASTERAEIEATGKAVEGYVQDFLQGTAAAISQNFSLNAAGRFASYQVALPPAADAFQPRYPGADFGGVAVFSKARQAARRWRNKGGILVPETMFA